MKLKDVMRVPAISVLETSAITHAAQEMVRSGCGFLPVVSRGVPVGVVTERDLITRIAARGINPQGLPVSYIMSSPAITLDSESDIEDAVVLMRQKDIHRIAITGENGKLVGVVSLSDLAGNAADFSVVKTLQRHSENTLPPAHPFAFPIPGLAIW